MQQSQNIMEEMFGISKDTDDVWENSTHTIEEKDTINNTYVKIYMSDKLLKEQIDNQNYYSDGLEFISIVIPSYNRFEYLQEVVDSIHEYADMPFELIIHDDNSNDKTKEKLQCLNYDKTSTVIYNNGLNLGLSESINRAVKIAGSEYIIMLNSDCRIEKKIFRDVINVLKCPFVGYVPLLNPYSNATVKFESNGTLFCLHRGIGSGCGLAFTKDMFNKVKGWNNSSVSTSNADVSFMIKIIKKGYFAASPISCHPLIKNLSQDLQQNKDSTIGRLQYDCSYPRIYNYNFYEEMSLKRSDMANRLMQYSYRVPEGEINIDYWHKFCLKLINEDFSINHEISKICGHDRWINETGNFKLTYREDNITELLNHLFSNYYIVQNASELKWLVRKVELLHPLSILEVGVERGGTLKVWEQLLPQNKNSLLIGIDLIPNMDWSYKDSKIDVRIIKGNSHDKPILQEVLKIMKEKNIQNFDFVYIDGEHTSEAAKKDFEFFGNLVRLGGIIGFHDINDVIGFINSLPQDKVQRFYKNPPFETIGMKQTIGTAIYYK